jgi:hypothetical protein
MSRWCERGEREEEGVGPTDGLSRSGGESRPRTAEHEPPVTGFGANRRELFLLRERSVSVRSSERATLTTLGRFRVVDAEDLVREIYGGDRSLSRADFEALLRQGLIRSATLRDAWGRKSRLLTLTQDGYDLARSQASGAQRLYWGFVKPAEAAHDSRFYRAFRHEETRLAAHGRLVRRVVLDYELKRGYLARLNAPGGSLSYRERQSEAARTMHLPIIDGHAVFPDFRIEYEDERGDIGRVDVEVASDNYHDHHIATKVSAGFQVYGGSDVVRRFGISGAGLGRGSFPEERSAVLLL